MNSTILTERLFSVLENDFNLKLNGIDRDTSIFEQLPLDSMQLVAIAVKIEETFGIELPLTFMEKPTINHLVKLVADAIAENNRPDHDRAN
jgi:acyl carrier protein